MVYTPLCYVRKIEKFSFSHIFADMLILATTIVIIVYASMHAAENGFGKGVVFLNKTLFLDMIGFAVYSYEGIGVILPIMDITEKPEEYGKIVLYVMATVMVSYVSFGMFTYFIYGDELVNPLITANLPTGSAFVWIIKIAFCFNLFFTYPLVIYPANTILESYMFGHMPKSKKRQWLKNISRAVMVTFTIVLALALDTKLDKFLSLLGGIACTPIAFTLPTLFHYKLCAETKKERIIDIVIIVLSLIIMVFCTGFTLWHWND